MARLAGGVRIVAAMHEEKRYGLTITAICSWSDSPPALIACINRQAEAHDPICSVSAYRLTFWPHRKST